MTSFAAASFLSCKKDPPLSANYTSAKFKVDVTCDGQNVLLDSFMNTNLSGNLYLIHRINFYISNITLFSQTSFYGSSAEFYIDPFLPSNNSFTLDSIPVGEYTELEFTLGLEPEKNRSYALAPNMNNVNMLWPESMGGGYHFLKMEGLFIDNVGIAHGYGIHLGRNENKVRIHLKENMIQLQKQQTYDLRLNSNEVFESPHTYDLNTETSYTMSDSFAMKKIKENLNNAFAISQSY